MKIKIFDTRIQAKEVLSNNDPKLLLIEEKEICIVRKNDDFYAFENRCPHIGEPLHNGNTNYLDEIICPLHTYKFSMKTGIEAHQRCKNLEIYKIIHTEDGIFLELN